MTGYKCPGIVSILCHLTCHLGLNLEPPDDFTQLHLLTKLLIHCTTCSTGQFWVNFWDLFILCQPARMRYYLQQSVIFYLSSYCNLFFTTKCDFLPNILQFFYNRRGPKNVRQKCCEYNNEDEDNRLNILSDKKRCFLDFILKFHLSYSQSKKNGIIFFVCFNVIKSN